MGGWINQGPNLVQNPTSEEWGSGRRAMWVDPGAPSKDRALLCMCDPLPLTDPCEALGEQRADSQVVQVTPQEDPVASKQARMHHSMHHHHPTQAPARKAVADRSAFLAGACVPVGSEPPQFPGEFFTATLT